jgi:hypothetical protein
MTNTSISRRAFARLSIATASAGTLLSAGCSVSVDTAVGSGKPTTIQYPFTGFTGISAGSIFEVAIRAGADPGVAVTVDDNLVEYLDITASGDRLRIQLKPTHSISGATMKAVVTLPELTSLELSGVSRGHVEGVRSPKALDIKLSGSSRLEGEIESGDLSLTLSGTSHAHLKGSAGNLRIDASGASSAEMEQLLVTDANIQTSGSSRAAIHVSGKLHAHASGASSVAYAGKLAAADVQTSGSASVKAK